MFGFFIYRHSPFRQHKTKDKHEIDRLTLTYVSMVNLKKSTLSTNWRQYFTSATGDGTVFKWSSKPRKGLAACLAKGVTSIPNYLKTLSTGPAPEIEPATSRPVVKCSTD